MQIFVVSLTGKTITVDVGKLSCPVETVKALIFDREGIPSHLQRLVFAGKELEDRKTLDECSIKRESTITLSLRLLGGKGGFGAMLRAQAKKKTHKTTDFSMCRDLSGRRLRHVNDEIILAKWREAKDKGEEFDINEMTKTGLQLWFLGTPGYVDSGHYKPSNRMEYMLPRKKSTICKDWERARADRRAPQSANIHWGCPRGARCDFAHGESDMSQTGLVELKKQREAEKRAQDLAKKGAYMQDIDDANNDAYMKDVISSGLSALKRARIEEPSTAAGSASPVEGTALAATTEEGILEEDLVIEQPARSPYCHCSWIEILAGSMGVTDGGNIEGYSHFSTAKVMNCHLVEGRWYYEVEVHSDGIMQIGWADSLFKLSTDSTDGVGDDSHSFAFDGARQMKWNGTNEVFGTSWEPGSIVGCELELSAGLANISYFLNGLALGSAFVVDRFSGHDSSLSYFPVVSLEEGEKLTVNIGQLPFKFQPEGTKSVKLYVDGDRTPAVISLSIEAAETKIATEESFVSIDLESVSVKTSFACNDNYQ